MRGRLVHADTQRSQEGVRVSFVNIHTHRLQVGGGGGGGRWEVRGRLVHANTHRSQEGVRGSFVKTHTDHRRA